MLDILLPAPSYIHSPQRLPRGPLAMIEMGLQCSRGRALNNCWCAVLLIAAKLSPAQSPSASCQLPAASPRLAHFLHQELLPAAVLCDALQPGQARTRNSDEDSSLQESTRLGQTRTHAVARLRFLELFGSLTDKTFKYIRTFLAASFKQVGNGIPIFILAVLLWSRCCGSVF